MALGAGRVVLNAKTMSSYSQVTVDSLQHTNILLHMKQAKSTSAVREIRQRRAKTITSIAVEAIQEMIATGQLAAGDRINESTLADNLEISRGPIREACRSLEQAGLLTSKTNRGMYVRQVTLEEARELYELRGAVVGLIGELIVKRGSDDDIDELQSLVDEMQIAANANDTASYYKLNLDFHDRLVAAARNSVAENTYKQIVNQLHLLRRRGLVQAGSLQTSNKEHEEIVAALKGRDPIAAASAMRTHVANGFSRLIASL